MRSSVRADRMQAAARGVAARQRDVDGFGGEARVERGVFERDLARGRARRRCASRARLIASPAALRWSAGNVPSCLSCAVTLPCLPSRRDAQRFERVGRVGRRDVGQRLAGQ